MLTMHGAVSILLRAAMLATWLIAVPASSQPNSSELACLRWSQNDWVRNGHISERAEQLSPEQVHPVIHALPRAVAALKARSAVPLAGTTAEKFTGFPNPEVTHRLRAFLVRAVFPNSGDDAPFSVRWDRNTLEVVAGGLGCPALTKHPIVVFLDRQPRHVLVAVATIY